MSELLERLQKLRNLPAGTHLFCPRRGPEDASYHFPDDLAAGQLEEETAVAKAEREGQLAEAEVRRLLVLDSLQILAYDGPDAAPYIDWLKKRLGEQMTSCDVCIRVYHRSRKDLQARLEEHYAEEEVLRFMEVFDDMNVDRIRAGLDHAKNDLLDTPPAERGIGALDSEGLYAIFETLSCAPFLRDPRLMEGHFDQPFRLVQSKKKLRLNSYTPAMTSFLFDGNEFRQEWAFFSWTKLKKDLSPTEFDWAVRDFFYEALKRVQIFSLEVNFMPTFWKGARTIIARLNQELITHSLRDIDIDIFKLMLDHLQVPGDYFLDLLASMQMLVAKAPSGFWDAMGAISPATIVEQVFNSPNLAPILMGIGLDEAEQASAIDAAFTWVDPFLASIKPANLTPASRALVNQFLDRLQQEKYAPVARKFVYKLGLKILCHSLRRLGELKNRATFVGNATVSDLIELVNSHLDKILADAQRPKDADGWDAETAQLALDIVQELLALDCLSMEVEREYIIRGEPVQQETTPSTPAWKTVARNVTIKNIDLPVRALLGGRGLVGLEKFFVKPGTTAPEQIQHFNQKFDALSTCVADIMERLNDAMPSELLALFETAQGTSAVMAMLFNSEESVRLAAVELLKTAASEDGRREAINQLLARYYSNVLAPLTFAIRRIARKRIFAPTFAMLKVSKDIIDVLCNEQSGLLRERTLTMEEAKATEGYWQALWQAITIIFEMTEAWSKLGHDKQKMMSFCNDTMEFADQLFGVCPIFTTALHEADGADGREDRAGTLRSLLSHPTVTMNGMVKWLRLRDESLAKTSVNLISKLLVRLQEVGIEAGEEPILFVEDVCTGKTKTKLSPAQIAQLEQALETHIGHGIKKEEEEKEKEKEKAAKRAAKQGSISQFLVPGVKPEPSTRTPTPTSEVDSEASTGVSKVLKDTLKGAEAFRAKLGVRAKPPPAVPSVKAPPKPTMDVAEIRRRRQAEMEAKKKRDAIAIANARRLRGISDQNHEAGSGLQGLGVVGKDHGQKKGEGMMVSSDESDSDVDPLDEDLFGITAESKKAVKKLEKKKVALEKPVPVGPVKKRKVVRSARDMRARIAPDLSPLHKIILSWDYFHEGDFPPHSRPDMYTAVPNEFLNPQAYKSTFEPLLTLEAWQGFVKAREESSFKPYGIKVATRSSVDAFLEVSSTMDHKDNKEIQISEGDVVLMSTAPNPATARQAPHCLARVYRIQRKKAYLEVSYRIVPGNPLVSALSPGATVYGAKIQSLTPLEREYGALSGLQYYDLCDEIIRARPSPLLSYTDRQLDPLIANYRVNKAQAKAIKSAVDNDAFTLIQGPPGSGKTKTIVAIVGAILTDTLRKGQGTTIAKPVGMNRPAVSDAAAKKLLVSAPSNAAVDELVMRLKEGVRTLNGEHKKINVVRIGRSDAINANVEDVMLEELVNRRLGGKEGAGADQREETQKLMKEHQAVSEKLRLAREQLDKGELKGAEGARLKDEFDALRRRKTQLGAQIDNARDNEQSQNRQAELNRRRVQQQILDESHVICGTLSGTGHDMFQSLNIEFETVIVDEAAQCVEVSSIIPLKYGCSKCILVGDPKQLPPTVFSKEAARFQYEQSLFVRMQGNHPNDVHLLDTQYRMHPDISAFPSATFYDGRLLDGPDMAALRDRPWHASDLLAPYRFFDVQGQHQSAPKGHSLINLAEIEVALQLYERLTTDFKGYDFRNKIGVITPYKSQLRELKDRFTRRFGSGILDAVDFNTTDAFQGRESEVIIFSCVRASPAGGIGFLQDIRRMNVGLTRAKSSLWVLGNGQSLMRGAYWRRLVEDAEARGVMTRGDVLGMLRAHSGRFPRKPGPLLKRKMSVDGEAPADVEVKRVKGAARTDPPTTTRFQDLLGEAGGDVEMTDAPGSGSGSGSGLGSGARTPASNGPPLPPPALKAAPPPTRPDGQRNGTAAAPAGPRGLKPPGPAVVKRRPPPPVDPFIRRNPPGGAKKRPS